MCVQNLKSVALPIPGIIGEPVLEKIWQSLDMPTLYFLLNFEWAFTWIGPLRYSRHILIL